MAFRLIIALAACVVAGSASSQPVGFPAAPPLVSPAQGTIDFHVHSEPDVFGRSIDGMEDMISGMLKEGVSQADIDEMTKRTPARLLGLEQ